MEAKRDSKWLDGVIDRWRALPAKEKRLVRKEAVKLAETAIEKFIEATGKAVAKNQLSKSEAVAAVTLVFGDMSDEKDPKFEHAYTVALAASLEIVMEERKTNEEKSEKSEGSKKIEAGKGN